MNLAGKTVVLTGATTGIGRAAALALADQPARLVIHGPQAAREVSGLTHSLQAAMQPGAELTYLRSDYSDLASVAQLAQDIRSSAGRIDVLINNAACRGALDAVTQDRLHQLTCAALAAVLPRER